MLRLLITLALLFATQAGAVIVDRVAIVAGGRVITDSDIDARIRLTAMQNGTPPDFSPAMRREAAQRLIDQRIVEREMDLGRYPRLDSAQRAGLLTAFAASVFGGSTDALDSALTAAGLTRAQLEADLARQSELLGFLNMRFRPAVPETEEKAAAEHADRELEAWLADQRKRTRIVFVERELQ